MASPDWASFVGAQFAATGADALKASKAVKRALSQAAESSGQSAEALRPSLDAFLAAGRCGYRLQDGKVVKAAPAQQHEQSRKKAKRQAGPGPAAVAAPVPPAAAKPEPEAVAQPAAAQTGDQAKTKKKKKRMHKEADGDTSTQQQPAELPAAPALAPAAEPAGGGDARGSKKEGKKKKKGKEWRADEAPSTQQQQQQQSVPVPVDAEAAGGGGSGGGSKKTKKKGKKQAEEEGDAAEQDRDAPRGQQHAQPPGAADGEQQHEQDAPPAKRRKKKATGAAAAAAGAAAGAASGSAGAGRNEAAGLLDDTEPSRWRDSNKRQDVKSGAFSKQEKETLRRAVLAYADGNGHSFEDTSWLYGSSKQKGTKGLWSKIAAALPHRTVKSVWAAGTRMFHEGNYQGKWTAEEDERLLALVEERGRKWTEIGGAVGRMAEACRDRWLVIRLGESRKKGRWDEAETEKLKKAVEEYQAAKAAAQSPGGGGGGEATTTISLAAIEGAVSEAAAEEGGDAAAAAERAAEMHRRTVLDDIDWNVVSQAVGSRSNVQCLEKWYAQLAPDMIDQGEWSGADDRRLLRALYQSGASQEYEVDWDNVVKGRSAQQTRRRWRLMAKTLKDHRDLEFDEQVSELVDVHMPQLKEGSATPADGGGGDGVGGVGSDGGEEAGSDGNESDGNEGRADSDLFGDCAVSLDRISLAYNRGSDQPPSLQETTAALQGLAAAGLPPDKCCAACETITATSCLCSSGARAALCLRRHSASVRDGFITLLTRHDAQAASPSKRAPLHRRRLPPS
ncbi:DNA-binding REB1 [Micractinium conductrix]|uniref:DNA-binding REB1 n=1 Tax=Micractinium conductrix TaxID=554055 RepID=A0A2P6VNS4_9CHLO|nr:DNA-binding REB1 [Micractinium conductrix]|eukprot:PSC75744.1 DNA-binding REB1 [Micractinium conductrix]